MGDIHLGDRVVRTVAVVVHRVVVADRTLTVVVRRPVEVAVCKWEVADTRRLAVVVVPGPRVGSWNLAGPIPAEAAHHSSGKRSRS